MKKLISLFLGVLLSIGFISAQSPEFLNARIKNKLSFRMVTPIPENHYSGFLQKEMDLYANGLDTNFYYFKGNSKGYVRLLSTDDFEGLNLVETDPIFSVSPAYGITNTNITNWGSAYSHIGLTNNPHSVTAIQVGLGNVTNESKATMFTSPTFTGTPVVPGYSKIDSTQIGYGLLENPNNTLQVDSNELATQYDIVNFLDSTQVRTITSRSIADSLANIKAGNYIVTDWGVSDDTLTDSRAEIQSTIDYANANGGGTVIFPVGEYMIYDSLVPKSNVTLQFNKGAKLWYNGFGTMFYFGSGILTNFTINGGEFYGSTNYAWDFLKEIGVNASTGYAYRNYFNNIYVYRARVGWNLLTTNDGWITDHFGNNITFWQCAYGIRTRESVSSLGIDAFMINNFLMEAGTTSVMAGIDSLSGSNWMINNIMFMDWYSGTTATNAYSVNLTSASSQNNIVGSAVNAKNYVDNGKNNYVVSNGSVLPWQATLGDSVLTSLVIYKLTADEQVGGQIEYTLICVSADGDSSQVETGTVNFTALDVGGTLTTSIDATAPHYSYGESIAGLTLNNGGAWQIQDLTNEIRVRVRFYTNINNETMTMKYRVSGNGNKRFQQP